MKYLLYAFLISFKSFAIGDRVCDAELVEYSKIKDYYENSLVNVLEQTEVGTKTYKLLTHSFSSLLGVNVFNIWEVRFKVNPDNSCEFRYLTDRNATSGKLKWSHYYPIEELLDRKH